MRRWPAWSRLGTAPPARAATAPAANARAAAGVAASLQASVAPRRHDTERRQARGRVRALGALPLPVEAQDVAIAGRGGDAAADQRQRAHEADEVDRELAEHVAERSAARQLAVSGAAHLDVVVHVDQASLQALAPEPGHVKRRVADVPQV